MAAYESVETQINPDIRRHLTRCPVLANSRKSGQATPPHRAATGTPRGTGTGNNTQTLTPDQSENQANLKQSPSNPRLDWVPLRTTETEPPGMEEANVERSLRAQRISQKSVVARYFLYSTTKLLTNGLV